MTDLDGMAAVVIGRNEGLRLEPALKSVQGAGLPLVYVDSGSVDGSPRRAREMGVAVVEVDPRTPFSAGRGRNEGLQEVLKRWPNTRFVLFLDGDCILDPRFPPAALGAFDQHEECAIITGHLSERFPDRSVYNRLCAIEWQSPSGLMTNMNSLGGIMVVRVSAFLSVGGFKLQAIAGEEPDLGSRLITAGHTIIKVDAPMATHDAEILKFSQWWKRAARGGHALAFRYSQHGRTNVRETRRELASDLAWGLILPVSLILLLWPTDGLSLLLLIVYPLFGWRIFRRHRANGLNSADARLLARYIVFGKFAHVVGIATYCRNRLRGEFRIIEYK
ncbi:MAG TPA: glycosyltransferase family 2 protein [Sphingomicrobium sp.]|nr:glycosyltransferase family 2 protein [Sphingomicrobium sp.]